MRIFLLLIFLPTFISTQKALCQSPWENQKFDKRINSIQLHQMEWELSPPVYELGSNQPLLLEFDILGDEAPQLQYKLIHCDRNWVESNLLPQQYLDGFNSAYIQDSEYSFNTWMPYVHYKQQLPNAELQVKISGNYIVVIFENDEDSPLFTSRLLVVEPRTEITARVKRSDEVFSRDRLHEVDFNVSISGFQVSNPSTSISATILQNFRWDNAINNLKPAFIGNNELVFDYTKENSFSAGNEYRYLNLKSLQVPGQRVYAIDDKTDTIKVYLKLDPKRDIAYSFMEDINGQFLIHNDEGNAPQVDGQYLLVHFELPFPSGALKQGNIYLNGAFAYEPFSSDYRMDYNYDKRAYVKKIWLKQGYYNFQYLLLQDGHKKPTPDYIEGSFYETENEYSIITYFRDIQLNADRIIGFTQINSTTGF